LAIDPGSPPAVAFEAAPMGRRVLRCFPSSDDEFRAAATAAFQSIEWTDGHDQDAIARDLLGALAISYPDARFVRQDPIAALVPDEETWYAYRDGHPVKPGG
jgi:hypothetical protein